MCVSVVLPCLDEAEGVVTAVQEALQGLRSAGLSGQVIVVDNGSTDGSAVVAAALGATIVWEPRRGYGMAIRRGLQTARGDVIADADSSYDLCQLGQLVQRVVSDTEPGLRSARGRSYALAASCRHGAQSSARVGDWALVSRQPVRISCLQTRSIHPPWVYVHWMEYATEMLLMAHRAGFRIEEVRAVSSPDRSQQAGRRRAPPLPLAVSFGRRGQSRNAQHEIPIVVVKRRYRESRVVSQRSQPIQSHLQ